jgi:hydroxyacid-oxoacid transhydrogenase
VFDLLAMKAKTAIAHRDLRPSMGLVDPDNTQTQPKMVTACSGLDVLCHGLESYTALPFHMRSAPDGPGARPTYQGSNPISDVWATRAIEMVATSLVRAVHDPDDVDARAQMLLAATFAGVGFGNAGVHLPHGMSYPVSGMVSEYAPTDYPGGRAIVPHGMSVALNAPAVFRFTAPADPERHLEAARLLGADVTNAGPEDAGDVLADAIVRLLRAIDMPNGLASVGYTPDDVGRLAAGTLPQHRVTKLSPRPAEESDLQRLFLDSMTLW